MKKRNWKTIFARYTASRSEGSRHLQEAVWKEMAPLRAALEGEAK